jgi:hypothetical protein
LPTREHFRALPSLPADEVRRLRRDGRIEDDFSTRLRIRGVRFRDAVALPVIA